VQIVDVVDVEGLVDTVVVLKGDDVEVGESMFILVLKEDADAIEDVIKDAYGDTVEVVEPGIEEVCEPMKVYSWITDTPPHFSYGSKIHCTFAADVRSRVFEPGFHPFPQKHSL
jgi:hypothetical protein